MLPENIKGEEQENVVVDIFQVTEINVGKRHFHAINRLKNRRLVIAKLVNRREALDIIKNKKKLRTLNENNKRKLNSPKNYVNESLCPKYRKLLGKCNVLYKNKKISRFHTMNGKIKIKINNYEDDITTYNELDFIKVFGEATTQAIEEERAARNND